jgi:SEC-C motif
MRLAERSLRAGDQAFESQAIVRLVPEVIDADALAFAELRAAHLEPPRQVADDLFAAASQPAIRLRGVTPYQVRMVAAKVLNDSGDELGALEVLDSSPDTAGAGLMQRAEECLHRGDLAAAQSLMSQIRSWPIGDTYGLSLIMAFVLTAADAGYFEEALAWTDAAWTAAMDNRAGPDWLVARGPQILRLLGEQVREQQQRPATDDGTRTQPQRPTVDPARAARPQSALAADSPPWPTLVDGRLLWWPHAEYQRLVAQVPDLGYVIGPTWQQHKAKVESTLRTARHQQPNNRAVLRLARAEFNAYVRFLELAGSDPRLPEPMTAFTGPAAEQHKPTRWPPGRLDRCWCGSGLRYSRCCGA